MKFNNLIKTILLETEQHKPVDWDRLIRHAEKTGESLTYDLNGNVIEHTNDIDCQNISYVNINSNGNIFFYKGSTDGKMKMHRLDGPAIICDGSPSYYIDNKEYTKEEFDRYIQKFGGAENTKIGLDLLDI
jgi:hypothetical protein